ncbi:RDD family protein [Nocardioides sp.]|uniref:RDD family protein n=1 Tax=Nocardioides sp. TaxID=35761 RepID=UPI00261B66CC|nr:RDD family protein [Nocardioides sp.]MDI6909328.1 RDD family protein [Nocardioides sp.]
MTTPTSTPSPSWYDLLGVNSDAPAEEIRAAWRAQIAELEPTDRRFAVLNQAAEVLLDPARRAAYDHEIGESAPPASLPPMVAHELIGDDQAPADDESGFAHFGERAAGHVIDQMITAPGTLLFAAGLVALFFDPQVGALLFALGLVFAVVLPVYNRVFRQGATGQTWGKSVTGIRLVSEQSGLPIGATAAFVREILHVVDAVTLCIGYLRPLWDEKRQTFADKYAHTIVVKATVPKGATRQPFVPGALLVGLAALTAAVAAPALWLTFEVSTPQEVESDARAAQAAAERAVVPILSYDATHLDESKAAAQQYLTGSLRKDYDNIFAGLIEQNAPATRTVVQASLVRSSIVRADGAHAQIFLLVNQTRTNKKYTEPQVYKNWVTLTMDKVDGQWLVADLAT